jgi:DNA-binding FadR family transcriptional regulator
LIEAIAKESLQRLPSEIAGWLVQQIQAGNLAPGDQLPSERQLCEQFSVSRPVVREALSRLRSEGLIVTQQGRGAFVAEKMQRQSFRLQDFSLSEKAAQAHILELLTTIEVAATRLAAERRTDADLKKIRRGLIGMQYAIANDELGDEEDYAFHHAIVDATQNPHFIALSEYLEHSVRRLIRQARSNTAARYAHLIQDVQNEHQAIFDAIAAVSA